MKIALIKSKNSKQDDRGAGVYAAKLFEGLKKIATVDVSLTNYQEAPSDCDLYHFTYFDSFFLSIPFIRSKKTVITVHDLIPIKFPQEFPKGIRGQIKWQLQKKLLQNVEVIITDSEASKQDICFLAQVPHNKIHSIYLAPLPEFFNKVTEKLLSLVTKEYDLPKSYALYVGDINWNKNILTVVRSAQEAEVPLVVVSNSLKQAIDSNHPELRSAKIAKSEIQNSKFVKVLGYVPIDNLVALYQMASVLLFPSLYEGFGFPVVEAFASKCPVITSKRGSLKEVAGKGAYFINPENVSEISKALKKFSSDSSLRNQYIKNGTEQVKHFSWDKTVAETLKIYSSLRPV